MIGRTHEAGAVAALLIVARYYPQAAMTWPTILGLLIANTVGALLPDIDQASNRLWGLLPGGNIVGKVLRNIFLGHRTITHSLMGMGLVYYGGNWLLFKLLNTNFVDVKIVFNSLMIGYGSHLFLDGLTEEGLPLLWPLKIKFGFPPIKWMRIKTDHWVEKWMVFPGLVIYILVVVGRSIVKL
jgi:inner membrane protein